MPLGPIAGVAATAAAAVAARKKKKDKKKDEPSEFEKRMRKLMIKGALRKKGGGYNKRLTAAQRSRLGLKKRKTKDEDD